MNLQQPEALKTEDGNNIWNMITASIVGDEATARELLLKNEKLANCSWGYFTPLHFAVRYGHTELVRLLVDSGADATEKWLGWQDDPLTKAKDRGHQEIEDLLSQHLSSKYNQSPQGSKVCKLIRTGNTEEALRVLDESPDLLHASDERGNTPLHWAVLTRKLQLIDELIRRGAHLHAKRADGATPLQVAVSGDYWFRSNRDLSREALRNEWFLAGYLTARGCEYDIWTAAAIGDSERVGAFLVEDPSLANAINSVGKRPLSYAAKYGHAVTVKLLLDHGADPNAEERDAPQGSVLWQAVKGNHGECVRMLLENGANPNAVVEAGGNPLFIAMNEGHDALVNLLYTYGASMNLDSACCLGRIDLVGEIIKANPSLVNSGGDYGPLCMAAGYGHTDIVRLLIRGGADLNAPWYANNFMGYAADTGMEMVRLLLESGANPNNANWLGVSYLHKAACTGNLALAQVLIEFGANVNAIDEEYEATPLGWAAKYGQAEMVRFLLDHGADQLLPDGRPWAQPAAWAKTKGYPEIADTICRI